jgi:hypothetical protein
MIGGNPAIYPTIALAASGVLTIKDSAGEGICEIGKADEVISLKIEYYPDEGVYNVFVGGMFKGSATATYNGADHGLVGGIGLGSASTIYADYWVDNVHLYNTNKTYVDSSKILAPEKVYTFDTEVLGSDITATSTVGSYEISDGILKVTNSSSASGTRKNPTFKITNNVRSLLANGTLAELDIIPLSDVSSGAEITTLALYTVEDKKPYSIKITADGGYYCLDGGKSFAKTTTNIPVEVGTPLSLKLEYISKLGNGGSELGIEIYLNGSSTYTVQSYAPLLGRYGNSTVAYATVGASRGTSAKVGYDNVRLESIPLEYEYPSIPSVSAGKDAPTLDFEDRNVGDDLPDRISGDATIGAEIDGSNRYLLIDDQDAKSSKAVSIVPYGDIERATSVIFEFDLEYLNGTFSNYHDFYLIDADGNERLLFAIWGVSYSNEAGAPPYIRAFRPLGDGNFTMFDSSPNVVSRYHYYNTNAQSNGPVHNTTLKITVDLETGAATVTYRGSHSYTAESFTTSVTALKIVSKTAGSSVLAIDELRAEYINKYGVTAPTIEGFEGKYTESNKTLKENSSATDLIFESGTNVTYAGQTNVQGAKAEVITDPDSGNKYVKISSTKRLNSSDRGHGITLTPEACALIPNGYVFETDILINRTLPDGSGTYRTSVQFIIYGTNGRYIQYSMVSDDSGDISFGGVKVGKFDEWISLKFLLHTETDVIEVYTKNASGEYEKRGELALADAASNPNPGETGYKKDLSIIGDSISTFSVSASHTTSSGFSVSFDDIAFYSYRLDDGNS